MDSDVAKKTWEIMNEIKQVEDSRYNYDPAQQQSIRDSKPWVRDPQYFKEVHISAVAMLKMAMHARSGGSIEVMGSMQGKIEDKAFIVMDTFPLPVEGTETRVNAQADGYEFMVDYQSLCENVGRKENVVGWYHSHPGYGCWLSGIDVSTQSTNQMFQDPFLAVVIDPVRTMSSGKVDIGAFRTYPAGFNPPHEGPSEYQTIPLEKIEDFGVHCKQYYQLEVSCFKSNLDATMLDILWNKYWASVLSSSPLLQNRDYATKQIADLGEKMVLAEQQLQQNTRMRGYLIPDRKKGGESKINQVIKDSQKASGEHIQSLMSLMVKETLFHASNL